MARALVARFRRSLFLFSPKEIRARTTFLRVYVVLGERVPWSSLVPVASSAVSLCDHCLRDASADRVSSLVMFLLGSGFEVGFGVGGSSDAA